MDMKCKKSEIINKTDKVIKDRGDLKKLFVDISNNDKPAIPDCGDSNRKVYREKPDIKDGYKPKDVSKETSPRKVDKDKQLSQILNDNRRRIRERYTIRFKSNRNFENSGKIHEIKNVGSGDENKILEGTLKQLNDEAKAVTTTLKPPNVFVKPDKELIVRKPVIKIDTPRKNASKVIKLISIANKKNQPAQIDINLTDHNDRVSKKNNTKIIETGNRISEVKRKPVVRKRFGGERRERSRLVTSPDMSTVRDNLSPITEVAKWAPTSITCHTKPYYDAWVDKTLAVISRNHTKDLSLMETRNMVKTFRGNLEKRDESPELVYKDFSDEKFIGRIKIRQSVNVWPQTHLLLWDDVTRDGEHVKPKPMKCSSRNTFIDIWRSEFQHNP